MKQGIALAMVLVVMVIGLAACQQKDAANATNDSQTSTSVEPATASTEATDTGSADTATVDSSLNPVDEESPATDVEQTSSETTPQDESDPGDASATSKTRGPISILGDGDFTADNGVVGGTGTAEDPYVIAGWTINVPQDAPYGVRVENVTSQFVLRGLVIQNDLQADGSAIRVGFASGGAIEGCTVSNSINGVVIMSSTDIAMDNCVLSVSGHGLQVVGETKEQYRHQIADTNMYNNSPIYYYYGLDGDTISGLNTGHLTVAGSQNVTISGNQVVNGDGILLAFVDHSTVTGNVAHRLANVYTGHGIQLYESNNNVVTGNLVKNNRLAGIQLTLATSNQITGNEIYVNDTGIRLLASESNEVSANVLYSNVTGIQLLGGADSNQIHDNILGDDQGNMNEGIALGAGSGNEVNANLVFGSQMGIVLEVNAMTNTISDNTVTDGGYGIQVSGSNNTIVRNLVTQQERGILFPETYQKSETKGNTFRGNVLSDNKSQHIYTNLDSTGNQFTQNVFLIGEGGKASDLVQDQGTNNLWTVDGVGNYWGAGSVTDADGDGVGDTPITVYPSGVDDDAPMAAIDALQLGLGVLGTLDRGTVTIQTGDGDTISLSELIADTPVARSTGFRGFPAALINGFPGILFVNTALVDNPYTMATVPFDLDIAFFDDSGAWVGGTTMTAQAKDLYNASGKYQYALELPAGSLEELGIGSGSTLELP